MRVFIASHFVHLEVFESVANLECQFFLPEPHIFSGDKPSEEDVDSFSDGEGHGHHTVGRRLSVEAANEVREIVQDGEVVLHYDDVVVVGLELSNQGRADNSLLDVQV